MKKLLFLSLTLGASWASSALVQAAPLYHLTKVAWIVATRDDLDKDDRYVTIVGHVTRRIGDEEYWFTDGSGSVRLDSENFDLPVGPKLIIGGRIDQAYLGFGHIEVDVRHWRYAPVHRVAATKSAPVAHTVQAKSEPVNVPAPASVNAAPSPTTAPAAPSAPSPAPTPSLAPPTETAPTTN